MRSFSARRGFTGIAVVSFAVLTVCGLVAPAAVSADRTADPTRDASGPTFDVAAANGPAPVDLRPRYQADNPALGFRAFFAKTGVRIAPLAPQESSSDWTLDLSVGGYSFESRLGTLSRADLSSSRNRVDYTFADGPFAVSYSNGPMGFQQTFELSGPPLGTATARDSRVQIGILVSGSMVDNVSLADAGDAVAFQSRTSPATLRYALAGATGADGTALPARIDLLADSEGRPSSLRIRIDVTDGSYPVQVRALLSGARGAEGESFKLEPTSILLGTPTEVGFAGEGAPVNDTCATAEIVPGSGPFPYLTAITADITDATAVGDPPAPSCQSSVSRSVWYAFTPAATSSYTISSCADAPTASTADDTVMAVYTSAAGCAGAFTQIAGACDDDSCGSEINQSVITAHLTAGVTYYVVVFQFSTTAPTVGNTAVQLRINPTNPPANDTCAGAIPLMLDMPADGTNTAATNDYQISAPAAACFPGIGQTTSSASGRDTVWSFTAPSAGDYSFRATLTAGGGNPVLYTASGCPAAPPTQSLACAAGVLFASNRSSSTAALTGTEELMCQTLGAGQKVHVFVDEGTMASPGGPYTIEATRCVRETEPNGAPAQAVPLPCGIEGSIAPAGEIDFFALGAPSAGSRVFAMADGVAGSSTDFDMRITTTVSTLEYDDAGNATLWGGNSPHCAGTPLTGVDSFVRMSHFSATTQSEPYRLFSVVQPPGTGLGGSSATPETEPNAPLLSQANAAPNLFFSGTISPSGASGDLDLFRFCAEKGDLIFLSVDGDPLRNNTPINPALFLLDNDGSHLFGFDDAGSTSSTTSGAGSLTATSPSSPGEAAAWRARYSGTYYAGVHVQGTSTGDYLYSIGLNCRRGLELSADLAVTENPTPDPAQAGANMTYAIAVTNLGPNPALDAAWSDALPSNVTFASVTGPAGWTCALDAGSVVTCTGTCLLPNQPAVFTLVVEASPCQGNAPITNSVTVTSKTFDPVVANNSADATVMGIDLGVCNDRDPCTSNDQCVGSSCVGTPVDCNDFDLCTTDSCDPATGLCVHASIPCDDQNACTDDSCAPATGCVFLAGDANACTDSSACTSDQCTNGRCVSTQIVFCDDGNACTDDACDPMTGLCAYTPDDTNACSDGNACTVDVCLDGVCTCPTCGSAPTLVFTNETPLAIPDSPASPVTSTIRVTGAPASLEDLNLRTLLVHPASNHLEVTLRSPSGTVVTITTGNGAGANVFNGTLWDDQADPGSQITGGSPPTPYGVNPNIVTDRTYATNVLATPLTPVESLAAFRGEDPNGDWTLTLRDTVAGGVGTLDSWQLLLQAIPFTLPSSSVSVTNSTPLPIPDGGAAVSSTVVVVGAGTSLSSVKLTTFLPHTWPSDLLVTLQSPAGTIATITTQNAGLGPDDVFNGTVWFDEADPGSQIPYGTVNPNLVADHTYTNRILASPLVTEEPLAAFQWENPNGTWTLYLEDNTSLDTGTLNGWTLEIVTEDCSALCVVDCNDQDACTNDLCDPIQGCRHTPIGCDDGVFCTTDSCDPVGGCAHDPLPMNGAACDDSNPCTAQDTCSHGECVGTPVPPPAEVAGLGFVNPSPDEQTNGWLGVMGASQYDVVRGLIGALPVGPGGGDEVCFDDLPGLTMVDPAIPGTATGFLYVIRAESECGSGSWGDARQNTGGGPVFTPRSTTTCP